MSVLTLVRDRASSMGGTVLAGATRAVATARPATKPLHPRGRLVHARLYRTGLDPALGVPWLDEAGIDEVLVRESRAVGLPGALPDVQGLAVRIPTADGGHGDLLLATTGWGRLSRFVLTASRTTYGRPMTTLLPYRTAAGPLLVGARAVGPETVELACAVGRRVPDGSWRHFADLRISQRGAADPLVSFDPVLNRLPGLDQYGWVQRLREPAYDEAREVRRS